MTENQTGPTLEQRVNRLEQDMNQAMDLINLLAASAKLSAMEINALKGQNQNRANAILQKLTAAKAETPAA